MAVTESDSTASSWERLHEGTLQPARERHTVNTAGPRFAVGVAPQFPKRKETTRSRGPAPGGGEWWEHSLPFRHFTATDVLDAETYQELCHQFTVIVDATNGKCAGEHIMTRSNPKYDAYMLGMNATLATAFAPLFAEPWLPSLAAFHGLDFLSHVSGGLHSSPKGSRSGWIHTDFCSGWFDESDNTEGSLTFPRPDRCEYFTGLAKSSDAKPKEFVRAATLIFYLCNEGWKQGDGGETALYGAARQTQFTAVKLVPPLNNSMLLFECSPHSYHRFVANPGRTRNSIILWLHSTVDDAQARWGRVIHRRGSS
jgi:hypothetical protein